MSPSNDHFGNILLDTLPASDRALLDPHLEWVKLAREDMMVTPGEPIRHAYFPTGGICSITAPTSEKGRTEVGIFGREGVSATVLLLDGDRSPHETFVQVAGDHAAALRIEADPMLAALERSATLRRHLLRYVQTLFVQAAQSAVANAQYRIEARLARWLLMCHDRSDTDEILLTHEFMSMMIGAERSGVTVSLHILEGAGMIRSKRGRVIILDRGLLQELAGDSYGQPEAEYRRLIGPFGSPPAAAPAEGGGPPAR